MRKIILFAGLLAVPLMWAPAEAQQTVQVCVHSTTTSSCAPVNSSNGFPVNVVAGSGGNGAASATGSAVPADADYQGLNVGGTLRGQTGVNPTGSVYAGQVDLTSMNGTSLGSSLPIGVANGADVVAGTLTDSATCASGNTVISCLRQLHTDVTGAIPAQGSNGVLIGAVQGPKASGATADTYPLLNGGRAATAAPTAVTDGQAVSAQLTPEGRTVTAPYSIKELMVRGTATSTDTSAHTIIASAGGSLKNYITAAQCGRTDAGSSALTITFNDSASTVIVLPAGGATNIQFPTPLATAAATAFQFTSGTGVSTLYCSAQGYTGL